MGHPERISTLPCRRIKEIRVLSLRESGIEGPVSRDYYMLRDYITDFLAALMP